MSVYFVSIPQGQAAGRSEQHQMSTEPKVLQH